MEEVLDCLDDIAQKYDFIYRCKRSHWFYVPKKSTIKLVFYYYVKKDHVLFGISTQWTTLNDQYPMLKVVADEVWKSTLKWKLYDVDDIQKKWIIEIIWVCANYYWVKLK